LKVATSIFTLLTIGDGLVTQIPALIISTAAGMIVTRTATSVDFSQEVAKQLLMKPNAIFVTAGLMGFIALIPGFPKIPFLSFSIGLGVLSYWIQSKQFRDQKMKALRVQKEEKKNIQERLEDLLSIDLLELEVGYGLIPMVDQHQSGDLLERISHMRKQFALDLGIMIPPVRIRDHLGLKPTAYSILLKGVQVGSGTLMLDKLLAIHSGGIEAKVDGIPTKEPTFGLDAIWISLQQKQQAMTAGYTVVELSAIIATHLTEVIRQNAHELLGRQELQMLLDHLKVVAPKVVEELIPQVLPLGVVLRVLKNLLKEGISIRDLKTILETLADIAPYQKDLLILTEHVRASLARSITKKLVDRESNLCLMTLDRMIEETLASGIVQTERGTQLSIDPEFVRQLIANLKEKTVEMENAFNHAVVLCSPLIRPHLKNLIDRFIPNVTVLSHNEITPDVKIQSFGTVRMKHAS